MATLYRSPTLVIDAHEWHVRVETCHGRRFIGYRFRPAGKPARWESSVNFPGRKPKGLGRLLKTYRKHAEIALRGPVSV